MIEVARPGFLWAGALLAGLPLLLHFLRPKERVRKPLPTLRFLAPDARTRVRLRRRPDELLLLALRMGLCLLLGVAFAGVAWVGSAEGTGVLVVVDGGAGMVPVWDEALEAARGATGGDPTRLVELAVVRAGLDGRPRVTRFGPEDLPDAAAWSELAPGALREPAADAAGDAGTGPAAVSGEVRLAHLIRAVRDGAARASGVDSLVARIVTVPRWSAWGPGVVELRDELWPAAIELVVPEAAPAVADESPPTEEPGRDVPRLALLDTPEDMRGPLERALDVLGISPAGEGAPSSPALHLSVGPAGTLGEPWDAEGREHRAATEAPPPSDRPAPALDAFLLLDGRVLPGAGMEPVGGPVVGAGVPVLRVGGRPAAAAVASPGECRVALPLEPTAPILESGELALLLESLIARGCGYPAGILPLGTGSPTPATGPQGSIGPASHGPRAGAAESWSAFLEGEGPLAGPEDEALPRVVDARPLRGPEAGLPLWRLLLVLALGVALLEVLLVRRRSRKLRRGSV